MLLEKYEIIYIVIYKIVYFIKLIRILYVLDYYKVFLFLEWLNFYLVYNEWFKSYFWKCGGCF